MEREFIQSSPLSSSCIPLSKDFLKFVESVTPNVTQEDLNAKYLNNLSLLKVKLQERIQKVLPDISHLMNFLKSPSVITDNHLVKAFLKKKILILLMVSFFECLSKKSSENFDNSDWDLIASLSSNFDPFTLKYKWFKNVAWSGSRKLWTYEQDHILWETLKRIHPKILEEEQPLNIDLSWSKISFEMSKSLQTISKFKSDKECKERWHNHLNPFLKKNAWEIDDDIKLLTLSLDFPKKWATMAKSFPGRNQHQIKNRFVYLISKKMKVTREKARKIMAEDSLHESIVFTLNKLRADRDQKIKIESMEALKEEEKSDFVKKEEIINEDLPEIKVKKENNEESFVRNQMYLDLINRHWIAFNQSNFNFTYMMGMYFAYMSSIFPHV